MRTVVFDLDGTLADTSKDLIAAANACFQGLGLGDLLDPVADAETAFAGGRAMLRLGFERIGEYGEPEVDRQYPILLDAYAQDIDRHTVLYPGTMDAIMQLKTQGYAVSICTNKPEGLAETLMQKLGVRGEFGALVGADTLPVRKPDPAPYFEAVARVGGTRSTSLLVGDTITDRKTAQAAGVPCVLVTFGPSGRKVAELTPEALLDDYADLSGVVAEMIG